MTLQQSDLSGSQSMNSLKTDVIISLCLVLLTGCVYASVMTCDFISLDDPVYVTSNNYVNQGITSEGIRWAFDFSHDSGPYWMPLTMISHMTDSALFGMNPGMHHLVNLMLHALNVILVFLFFSRATGERWKSLVVAVLFAIHPMNVESVAWISCRKNLLSTGFWLMAMLWYLRYVRKPGPGNYLAVLALFVAGIMAKASVITLVFSLLLLDIWPLNRFIVYWGTGSVNYVFHRKNFRAIAEKVPFLIIACLILYLNFRVSGFTSDATGTDEVSLGLRISNAFVSYGVYLLKLVFPHNLAVYYPYPLSIPLWKVMTAVMVFVTVSMVAVLKIRSSPWLFTGWFWFTGNLVMVSGLIQGGLWPAYADRFAYIPQLGVFVIIVWGLSRCSVVRKSGWKGMVAAAVVAVMFIPVTLNQITFWKDGPTLYRHTLDVNPDDAVFMVNLAFALDKGGDSDGAVGLYRKILALYPEYAEAHVNLGTLLTEQGLLDEALYHFSEALRLKPDSDDAMFNCGLLHELEGRTDKALDAYVRTTEINTNHSDAHMKAGMLFDRKRDFLKAKQHFAQAVRLDPENRRAAQMLQSAKRSERLISSTLITLKSRLEKDPDNPDLLASAGSVYQALERYDEASDYYERSLDADPGTIKAVSGLAEIFIITKEYDRAADVYLAAFERLPEARVSISYNLACVYALKGDTESAVSWLTKTLDMGFRHYTVILYDEQLKSLRGTPCFNRIRELAGQDD